MIFIEYVILFHLRRIHIFTNFNRTILIEDKVRIPLRLIPSYVLIPNSRIEFAFLSSESRGASERACVSEEIVEANRHRQNIRCSPQLQLRERVCACLPACLPAGGVRGRKITRSTRREMRREFQPEFLI